MIDIAGKKFNRLTTIGFSCLDKSGNSRWMFKCDCGVIKEIDGVAVRFNRTKSCGCIRKGINLGNKNGMWKGNKVKYGALHDYIKYHLPKTELCQSCKLVSSYDIANISGNYKRDLSDWEWLCRKCHMIKDGRLNNLLNFPRNGSIKNNCKKCGNEFKAYRSNIKKGGGLYCSRECYWLSKIGKPRINRKSENKNFTLPKL